ncbi:MAG: hypothetical protein Kow0092_20160 [Deferrisomatales bacterium]
MLGLAGAGGIAGWGLVVAGHLWLGGAALVAGVAGAAGIAVRRSARETDAGGQGIAAGPAGGGAQVPLPAARGAGEGALEELKRRLELVLRAVEAQQEVWQRAGEHLEQTLGGIQRVRAQAERALEAGRQGEGFLSTLERTTDSLAASVETLSESVEEAAASVAQVHGALSGIREGIAVLEQSSDRSTEFVAQVGRAMGGIRETVEQTLDLSERAEECARRGRQVVTEAGEGVEKIQRVSQGMVQSVRALGEQSREIESIVGIITEVAEETGLLSLNAAILAAQAGEKGAAFGVVAEQIRSLARRTRESTRHIEGLVRGIQGNIAEANRGLADNLAAVEEGQQLGREAVGQLEAIEEAVGALREQAVGIAAAAQDQDGRSAAMVSAAGQVNDSLHQVAANLGQSMQEMGRIQERVASLAALAQSVRAAVEVHRDTGWRTAELLRSLTDQVGEIRQTVEAGDGAGRDARAEFQRAEEGWEQVRGYAQGLAARAEAPETPPARAAG